MNPRRWVLVGAVGALLVAVSSGPQPWFNALGGAFRPPDFAQDLAAAQILIEGGNPYGPDFPPRHARIMREPVEKGYPYFPHPPFAAALGAPFAPFGLPAAAALWFVISLVLVFVLAAALVRISSAGNARQPGRRSRALICAAGMALLLWPPVLYNLEKGQFSLLLAVLVAFAYHLLRRGRDQRAGLLLGCAAAIKVFPALLAGYCVPRHRRALIWFIVSGIALTALPLAWLGPSSLVGFVAASDANVQYWQTWPAVTYSIYAAVARSFIGGRWASPLVHAPIAAHILLFFSYAALLVSMLTATFRRAADEHEGGQFAGWIILAVLLNPLSMGHNGALLALPIVLIAQSSRDDARVWPKLAWAAGVILVSIPRQTIFALAPPPVTAIQGIAVVALPMWGALFLFASCLACCTPGPIASSTQWSDSPTTSGASRRLSNDGRRIAV